MSNSVEISSSPIPHVTQALWSFGRCALDSKKVSVVVSLAFGYLLASTLGVTTGLIAASTAYLLTENFRVRVENGNTWKLQKETELNLIKTGVQFGHISQLKAKIASLEKVKLDHI